jgi:hypothetical protein
LADLEEVEAERFDLGQDAVQAWLNRSAPVMARPVEAAAIWRNLRRGSIRRR